MAGKLSLNTHNMSHCKACDALLTDFEATRRYLKSKEEVELCNHCFNTIREDVEVIEYAKYLKEVDDTYDEEDE